MDEVKEGSKYSELEKQRKIFSRTLPDDIPETLRCHLCEKDAQVVRLTSRVAVYYHDCTAYDGIRQLNDNIALWVKRSFGKFSVEHGVIQVDINE